MFKRVYFALIISFVIFQFFFSKFEMSGRSALNKDFLDKNEFITIAREMGLESSKMSENDLNEAFQRLDRANSGRVSRNKAVIEISNLIAKQGRGVFIAQNDF